MVRIVTCLLVITLTGVMLQAQQKSQIVNVTQGDDLVEHTATSLQYIFPDFVDGNVMYQNGKTIPGKLNYNILLAEMQFVDPDSQRVFALADLNEVTMVIVGKRVFVPFSGREFLELLSTGGIQLAARFKGNKLSHGRQTPYGNSSPSARSSDMTAMNVAGGYMSSLEAKENVKVTVSTDYYLINGKKQTLITNSKNFLKVFPKEKSEVLRQFIEQHNINFNDRNNLISLINFCNQL